LFGRNREALDIGGLALLTDRNAGARRKNRRCGVDGLRREQPAREAIVVKIAATLSEAIGHPGERCFGK
jgi:hypothetical protein